MTHVTLFYADMPVAYENVFRFFFLIPPFDTWRKVGEKGEDGSYQKWDSNPPPLDPQVNAFMARLQQLHMA